MDIKEYKEKNVVHLKFPSGLELDVGLPSGWTLLFETKVKSKDEMEGLKDILTKLSFPEGFTVKDLNPTDFIWLIQWVNGFFSQIQKSLNGSQS